jgi:hypothetical protein
MSSGQAIQRKHNVRGAEELLNDKSFPLHQLVKAIEANPQRFIPKGPGMSLRQLEAHHLSAFEAGRGKLAEMGYENNHVIAGSAKASAVQFEGRELEVVGGRLAPSDTKSNDRHEVEMYTVLSGKSTIVHFAIDWKNKLQIRQADAYQA